MIVAVLAFNAVYSINEQEQAVVTTFGTPTTVSSPGLHYKIPFLQQVTKVSTVINGFPISYKLDTKKSRSRPNPLMMLRITISST